MPTDIQSILSSQLPIDSSSNTSIKQLSIGVVDKLADELVTEYDNQRFRRWYCGVVYQFGLPKVMEWRRRASEGKQPAKLFSHYVAQARLYKYKRESENG